MGSDRLPDGWRCYPLGDPRVCVLNPPKREVRDRPDSTKVTFVPMSAVDDESMRSRAVELQLEVSRATGELFPVVDRLADPGAAGVVAVADEAAR